MDIIKKIAELSEEDTPFVLATIVKVSGSSPAKPGFRLAVSGRDRLFGTIGGGTLEKTITDEAFEILEGRKKLSAAEVRSIDLSDIGMECGGSVELLLEYFGGSKTFILFGGGHLGRALAPILEILDFNVTFYDNRDEVRHLIHTANRSIVIADYNDISPVASQLSTCEGCFIATHGHEWDQIVLSQVLKTAPNLSYIGMIGSKVKVRTILNNLKAEGLDFPAGLHTPVGLKIGGDTAAEIAVSIAAEIIAVKNGAETPHMKINIDYAE